jgi:hypothetical protein
VCKRSARKPRARSGDRAWGGAIAAGSMNPAGEIQQLERQIENLRKGQVMTEAEVKRLCEKVRFSLPRLRGLESRCILLAFIVS